MVGDCNFYVGTLNKGNVEIATKGDWFPSRLLICLFSDACKAPSSGRREKSVGCDDGRFISLKESRLRVLGEATPYFIRSTLRLMNLLITHQPPYGILDFTEGVHYGNISLLGRVLSMKPRLHLFGHVHKANGKVEAQDTLYVNGCIVSDMKIVYKPQRLVIN